jgi:hypothetical protein
VHSGSSDENLIVEPLNLVVAVGDGLVQFGNSGLRALSQLSKLCTVIVVCFLPSSSLLFLCLQLFLTVG